MKSGMIDLLTIIAFIFTLITFLDVKLKIIKIDFVSNLYKSVQNLSYLFTARLPEYQHRGGLFPSDGDKCISLCKKTLIR